MIEGAGGAVIEKGSLAVPTAEVGHRGGGQADPLAAIGIPAGIIEVIFIVPADDPGIHRADGIERSGRAGRENGVARVADPIDIAPKDGLMRVHDNISNGVV